MIHKKTRTYIPADLEMKWEALEPLFKELCDRPINSAAELEHWLQNRSELEAAIEEDFAWRYIRMTCDTTSEQLLQNFQYFATEIEPQIAPYSNELNKKLVASPYLDQLDHDKFFIYLRGVKNRWSCFARRTSPSKPRSRWSSKSTRASAAPCRYTLAIRNLRWSRHQYF